jgi:hypothetical protein
MSLDVGKKKNLDKLDQLQGPVEILYDSTHNGNVENLVQAINILESQGWECENFRTATSPRGIFMLWAFMRKRP